MVRSCDLVYLSLTHLLLLPLPVRLWGILIYYYVPILVLLIFSIGCCIKAYFSIFQLPSDTQYILGNSLRIMKIQ